MRNEPTYAQIASDWGLWAEYVDPEATMSEAEFDAISVEEKIAIQTACFGDEEMPDIEAETTHIQEMEEELQHTEVMPID